MSDTTFFRGENPLKADKLNAAFSERVKRTGDVMQGPLELAGDPVLPFDAATKQYVDAQISGGPAPVSRNDARLQAQWPTGTTVANCTVYFYDMPYAGTVDTLRYFTGVGSFTVAVQINGVNVTGLSAVAVSSSTPAIGTASGANTFAKGARVTFVITGVSTTPAPTDALLSAAVTWS